MKSEDIARIIDLMERHGIAEFEYESDATHLKLNRDAEATNVPQVGEASLTALQPDQTAISSPGVGWFLISHPATTLVPPALPRRVEKNEIVGYVRTGALLRPVLADRDCQLLHALQADGAPVGYGEALFAIAP